MCRKKTHKWYILRHSPSCKEMEGSVINCLGSGNPDMCFCSLLYQERFFQLYIFSYAYIAPYSVSVYYSIEWQEYSCELESLSKPSFPTRCNSRPTKASFEPFSHCQAISYHPLRQADFLSFHARTYVRRLICLIVLSSLRAHIHSCEISPIHSVERLQLAKEAKEDDELAWKIEEIGGAKSLSVMSHLFFYYSVPLFRQPSL